MNGTPEVIDLASTEYSIAEMFFSVKLTPDERNAGVFCYGFDLMIYGGDVFSVKLTPDERNAGVF